MRFLVAGNDLVAREALATLLARRPDSLAGVLTRTPEISLPPALAEYPEVFLADSRLLQSPENVARLRPLQADWLISAYNKVRIPPDIVALYRGRIINVHPGVLPEYAGMYAYQWAIRNGEEHTGASVHFVDEDIDTGDLIRQEIVPIYAEDTAWSVRGRVLVAGARLIRAVLEDLLAGRALASAPQDLARRRLYQPREAQDPRIDWRWSARQIVDFVRAGNFEGHATSSYTAELDAQAGFRIRVLALQAGDPASTDPGRILRIDKEGPVIACGQGQSVRVIAARLGREPMSAPLWRMYLARVPKRRLLGRQSPLPPLS